MCNWLTPQHYSLLPTAYSLPALTAGHDNVNGVHLIGLKLNILNLGIWTRPDWWGD